MKKWFLAGVLLATGSWESLHAQSLRGGGCSDLYGVGEPKKVVTQNEPAHQAAPRVRLVSTNADAKVLPIGLFRHGGCTNGNCSMPIQYGPPAATGYYTAPAANYVQSPVSNYSATPSASNYFQTAPAPAATGCAACGNAVIAYGNTIQRNAGGCGAVVVATAQRSLMDCGPVNSYKVVLEPKYFTESRAVCTTEYQNEVRYRTKLVPRTVPIETQDFKTITVMVPRSETKTIEYTVLVPQTSEKSVDVVDTVPVWTEIPEQYTVKVPQVSDVPEDYKVRVPQLADEEFTYTVQVPQALTETRMQTVTNAIPVTKTRTVQTCQPVTRMQTVSKDYGHWEDRVEEVAFTAPVYSSDATACSMPSGYPAPATCGSASYGSGHGPAPYATGQHVSGSPQHSCHLFRRGGCGASAATCSSGCGTGCGTGGGNGCGSMNACGGSQAVYPQPTAATCNAPAYSSTQYSPQATQTVTRRVWVANFVTEEVAVVENVAHSQEVAYTVYEQKSEQVPYECTYLLYRPETRTGTRKVVKYVEETRTRTRKVVQYIDETRTRTRKQLSYKQETRTETIPVVSYTPEKRTKDVTYTFNIPETKVEPFTSTRFETVNEEVSEEYSVSVPVATTKEVQVQVCRMVPKLVPVTIYPCAEAQPSGCSSGCGGSPTLAPATPACSNCTSGCASCQ